MAGLSQPHPNFAPASHLPALTKDGWPLSSNLNVVSAQYFGYALDLGEINPNYLPGLLGDLSIPGTFEYGMVQLASNNPSIFKLSVHTDRQIALAVPEPSGYWCTNSAGLFTDGINSWQYITNTQFTPVPSPECPDNYWQAVSTIWGNELKTIRSNTPIAIILNDGEYGMQEFGGSGKAWNQDPRVLADAGTTVFPTATNGYQDCGWWTHYATLQKSHQLGMQTAAFRQAAPDRQLYIYYTTGAEETRTSDNSIGCDVWGFDSTVFATNSDLPSFECYYQGWAGHDYTNETGQSGDLLTEYLNAVGFNLNLGYTNNYCWVCGGWSKNAFDSSTNNPGVSTIPLYMGFLKCLYTGGMVGCIAGYYDYPTNNGGGFNTTFPSNNAPNWLQQINATAQVHALFSHLDNYLYNGALLSGPQAHAYSTDQPAYEFTNTTAIATARVLARKLNGTNQWLITAWASNGSNCNVTVNIPVLGAVTVFARDCGSVYEVIGNTNNMTLIDTNGLLPTASFPVPPGPPSNLHVLPTTTN